MQTEDRYIIDFDENQEIALETKDLHIYYGDFEAFQKRTSRFLVSKSLR